VSRNTLRGIADQFQHWLKGWTEKRKVPVLDDVLPLVLAATVAARFFQVVERVREKSS
jgi:hypothetical protein